MGANVGSGRDVTCLGELLYITLVSVLRIDDRKAQVGEGDVPR
jgi:hypothetical protein